jgi:glycosyltransferase involved in cell wall biosynthesis
MTRKTFPITAVLVSYHKADVIGQVIGSLAAGSVVPDLLVVADDGSSDGTPDVAEAAAKRAGIPARILRHPRAGRYRLQTMRNSGISLALEGVVIVSDSDCIFDRYTVESHAEIQRVHPLAIGTGPRFEYLEGKSGPFTSMYTTLEFAHFRSANYMVPFGANLSFRKSLWRRLGGFDRAYEGNYGFDDHEFCIRAELIGGVCVADPGAYVYHCPHDTIFGGRPIEYNAILFKNSLRRDLLSEQWLFLSRYVMPWYWRGNRKTPLLGDKIALDEWGAPPGFRPPVHLQMTRSLAPLLDRVARALSTGSEKDLGTLKKFVEHFNPNHLPRTHASTVLMDELRPIVGGYSERTGETRATLMKLFVWYEKARPWEEIVQAETPPAPRWSPPEGSRNGTVDARRIEPPVEGPRAPARAVASERT